MTDTDLMPFGKYKGKKMIDVPATYLIWFWEYGNGWPDVRAYIKDNLCIIRQQSNLLSNGHPI